MNLSELNIDKSWTLFLDRDGVINRKLENDYVKRIDEFHFLEGVIESLAVFAKVFGRIVIVTNQQGIGKGLMSETDLDKVHNHMLNHIMEAGGRIDKIYHCPELAAKNAPCRKPNIGMAEEARADFPEIDFTKSLMVGDSISDMQMGRKAGMKTVFVSEDKLELEEIDYGVNSLEELQSKI